MGDILLKNSIAGTAESVPNFSNGVVEVLGLHIKPDNLLLIAVYRQPDDLGGGHRSTSMEFRHALTEIKSLMINLPATTPDIALCGGRGPAGMRDHGKRYDKPNT